MTVGFCLSLAPVAIAGSSTLITRGSSSFAVRASNGYEVSVERFGHSVSLVAGRAHGFLSSAGYTVPSRVSPDRIDANFGKFGRVEVEFETHRIHHGPPLKKGCSGRPETIRFGVFTGVIRFRGERGYVSLDAHRAHGRVSSGSKEHCELRKSRSSGPLHAADARLPAPELTASEGHDRLLSTWVEPHSKSVVFEAATSERRGRIEIFRTVEAAGKPPTFAFADDLSMATLRPPRPFDGEATFQRTPTGPVWSGPLTVTFPGRDDVRFAGPRFDAELVREEVWNPGRAE